EFLANVSHELRTPLNSIIGFAELLHENVAKEEEHAAASAAGNGAPIGPDDITRLAKRKRYLENILGAAKSLLDMINGLLEKGNGKATAARVTLRAERLVGRGSEGVEAQDRVRISVLDTGPGIAPEDQKRIFQKFEQLDTGHTRRHAGTGLGLAICKELTTMLQGELQVESELGRGAMFSVILPRSLDAGRSEELRAEMSFRGRLAGQR